MTGIHKTETMTMAKTDALPTMSCSISTVRGCMPFQTLRRSTAQMSIVKIVDAELNTDVREDIKAANITDSINPRNPGTIFKRIDKIPIKKHN